jgi:predicted nucleic acid-binding protein
MILLDTNVLSELMRPAPDPRVGRPVSVEDAQIAAIARSAGLTLATRNVSDFDGIDGVPVVNPWD